MLKDAPTPQVSASCDRAVGFVALSKFVVANGMVDEVKEAFRRRPHLVERSAGYVRMDVLSPRDRPEEVWLVTFWTDAESYRSWHRSHLYRDSHRGIPKGLKLLPGETLIREFEYVTG
jgi:heme oxygenase (mycobilin-producing)